MTQKSVMGGSNKPLAPWSWRQTVVGTTLTLAPWLALAIGSQALAGSSSHATPAPPSATADALGGVAVFVFSAVVEAVFLLAPLYFALTMPVDGAREDGAPTWRARWGFVIQALALGEETGVADSMDGKARMSRWNVIWLTAWVSALALGASAIYSYALSADHASIQTNADVLAKQAQTAPLTTLGALLAAVVVAPWCEEVFFRGFVFPGLLRRLPLWLAAVLSALLFALAHADIGSFLPLALIGLALAYLRWRTRSLWPCVALHTLNNLVAAALLAPAFFR